MSLIEGPKWTSDVQSSATTTSTSSPQAASTTPTTAMGTTTLQTGFDFVGNIFAAIIARLEGFGIWISDGLTRIADLFADHLTVGSSSQPAGITLYDEDTGEPYCAKIKGGQVVSVAGACGEIATSTSLAPAPTPEPAPTPPAPSEVEVEPTPEPTASSTDPTPAPTPAPEPAPEPTPPPAEEFPEDLSEQSL